MLFFPLKNQDTILTTIKVLEESSSAAVSELLLSLAGAEAGVLESFPTQINIRKLIWPVKLKYSLSVTYEIKLYRTPTFL